MKNFIAILIALTLVSCGDDNSTTAPTQTTDDELSYDCSEEILTGVVEAGDQAREEFGVESYRYTVNPGARTMDVEIRGADDEVLANALLAQTVGRDGPIWTLVADGLGEAFEEVGKTRYVLGVGFFVTSVRSKPGQVLRSEALLAPDQSDHYARLYGATSDIEGDPLAPGAIWSVSPSVLSTWKGGEATPEDEVTQWADNAGVAALKNSELARILDVAWHDDFTQVAYEHTLTCAAGIDLTRAVREAEASQPERDVVRQQLGCSKEEEIRNAQQTVSKVLDAAEGITGFASSPLSSALQNATGANVTIDAGGGFKFKIPASTIGAIVAAPTTIGVGAAAATAAAGAAPFALGLAGIGAGVYIAARVNDAFGEDIARAISDSGSDEQKTQSRSIRSSGSSGDPHLFSLDGMRFDMQGHGEYVFVRAPGIEVQVRQEPATSSICPGVATNQAVAMRLNGVTVEYVSSEQTLEIDGNPVVLEEGDTLDLGDGHYIEFADGQLTGRWKDGSWTTVMISSNHLNILFHASDELRGRTSGLLGTYNSNPDDDFTTRAGDSISSPDFDEIHNTWAASWRVSDEESLFTYPDGESTADYTDTGFPGQESTVADLPMDVAESARQTCLERGVSEELIEGCILDVGCTSDDGFADSAAAFGEEIERVRRVATPPPTPTVPPGPKTCDEVDRDAGEPFERGFGEIEYSGTLRVSGRQVFDGDQTVTVAPGTVFIMEPESYFYWGWRGDPATVFMQGTEEAPILFCGATKGRGVWRSHQFLTGLIQGSVLQNVRIEDAGFDDEPALWIDSGDAAMRIENVTVVGNQGPGFSIDGLLEGSTNLVSKDNAWPGVAAGPTAVTNLPYGDYTGNDDDRIRYDGIQGGELYFKNLGVPWHQVQTVVTLDGSADTARFEAGTEVQFCDDCYFRSGWRSDPGLFVVEGTSAEPVIFTSANPNPTPGIWRGVELLTGSDPMTSIDHAVIDWAGQLDSGAIFVNGPSSITNTTIRNSAGYGIFLDTMTGVTLMDNTFENVAQGDTN